MADLHLDQDVALATAGALASLGHFAVMARDLNMEDATDDQHLLSAATANRILVSGNRKDFKLLHEAWLRWSAAWGLTLDHPGILIVHQSLVAGPAAARIDELLQSGQAIRGCFYAWSRARQQWERQGL